MSEYIRGLKLDIITCILGLGGGAFIMGLYLKSPTVHLLTLGGALFFASLAYLILSRINDTRREDIHICKDKSTKNVLEAAFLILFAISLVTYHASENRTIFYFISISLCTGIVALLCAGVTKKEMLLSRL